MMDGNGSPLAGSRAATQLEDAVLAVSDLTVSYRQGKRWLDAVRDVSLRVEAGQTYGLVGESGSGKSTLALAVLRHLPPNGRIRRGSVTLAGRDLSGLDSAQMRQIWQQQVKLVPQNPLSALNPSLRIGEQLAESLPGGLSKRETQARVLELLQQVRLPDPQRVVASYPHQLSGGMQQRIMIAMALSTEPLLMVLDEPTTNLDVTTEAAMLDLFRDLIQAHSTAVLYVSHNLGVIANVCDRVAVLYAGELVEDLDVPNLLRRPLHPYTQALLNSVPRLGQNKAGMALSPIPGGIPRLDELPAGCVFAPRCPAAVDRCHVERPTLDEPPIPTLAATTHELSPTIGRRVRCHRWPEILSGELVMEPPDQAGASTAPSRSEDAVLEVAGLVKRFPVRRTPAEAVRRQQARQLRAVDDVDLRIGRGRTLGVVGESGSGKTTIARCIIGLAERTAGDITLLAIPLARGLAQRDREVIRHLQMVFQNPEEALNPHMTVGAALRRPLMRLQGLKAAEADAGVSRLLEAVRLPAAYAHRLPAQLSGGEKQRVAIARAFASNPDLLILDESVSALDVSVQASILNMLNDLQRERESTYLFISHDLSVVGYLADEIAVVYLGKVVEAGQTADLFAPPYHPYTEALLSAIPLLGDEAGRPHIRLEGNVPSPIDVPAGCRFHPRCPRVLGDICATEAPPWQEGANGHRISCHIPLDELRGMQAKAVSGRNAATSEERGS